MDAFVGKQVMLTDEEANPVGKVLGTFVSGPLHVCYVRCDDGTVIQVERDSLNDIFLDDGIVYIYDGWVN